ncbi:MAG: sigma-70 family RNA polymerase sigma factor [Candidatus Riflebacteria bacterium]|nr:sigma-70 family RNA polymerase sigma factor [Candidatus Riflebacteria bacterium]
MSQEKNEGSKGELNEINLIVKQVLSGKHDSFAEIVRRFQHKIYGMAIGYTRNPESASDLTQEIFLETFKSLSRFDQTRSFTNWILKIASNHCYKFLRKKTTLPLTEDIEQVSDFDPLEVAVETEAREQVLEAFNKLGEDLKITAWLFYFFERSCNQISEILEIPLSLVKVRLFRARQAMGFFLEKNVTKKPEREI